MRNMSQYCRRNITQALVFAVFSFAPVFISSSVHACCWACPQSDCDSAEDTIDEWHEEIEENTTEEFDDDLLRFQDWMIDVFLEREIAPAMGAMASQMTTVAAHYTQMIGAFLDAQVQMDTQRVLRKLTLEAHNDYRPSEEVCYFGTNVKSLTATDMKGRYNSLALSRISVNRQLGTVHGSSGSSSGSDYQSRWRQFVDTYCEIRNNNFQSGGTAPAYNFNTGLSLACDHDGPGGSNDRGAEVDKRINRDIDYTRLLEDKRTIEIDLTDNTLDYDKIGGFATSLVSGTYFSSVLQDGDEEDIIALSKNLYGSRVLSREIADSKLRTTTAQKAYLALRQVVAKRNVAQATFNAIVGLKSAGTTEEMRTLGGGGITTHPTGSVVVQELHQTRRYMLAIMNELLPGNPQAYAGNIFDLIGYSPSYYAQLEILAKRIYQNPDFYADLYDTPANVKRKRVAMKAIELMLDRTIYESQLRREMGVSVLLSSKLRASYRDVGRGLEVGENQ